MRAGSLWIAVALAMALVLGCQGADAPIEAPPKEAPATEAPAAIEAGGELDRTVLPIAEPVPPLYTELDVRNATPPPRFDVKAPEGAPNVLLILVDDLGFAGTGTYGSINHTPTFDRLADGGVHYNNFHTTAVCSPTRAALKSGRNHHVNNMGSIIETGTAFPGNTGSDPQRRRARGRDAAPQRLRHRRLRQVARDRRPGKRAWPDRSTAGRPTRASTSSTASSAAKPTSGRRSSTTAPTRSSCPTIPTTTS